MRWILLSGLTAWIIIRCVQMKKYWTSEKNRKVMLGLVSTHLYLFGLTFDNLFCFPKGWRKRFELRREMNAF